jgi:hypothetical protein
MKRWKAVGAGLAALGLLVLVARMGLGWEGVDQSRKAPTAAATETGPTGTGDGLHRVPDPRRATVALPALKTDPVALRLTRRTLEQAWQDGALYVALPRGGRYSVALEEQRLEPGGQWTVVGRVQTRLGPQAMVLTFGPDAVFGVLPRPDGSLLQVTTTRGDTEIAAAGGMLPRGRTSRLATAPDYAIPRASRGQPASGGHPASRSNATRLPAAAAQSASTQTEIVVLGLYSGDLVTLRGSVSAAETEMTNLFAIANQTHVDSGTGVRFKVADLMQVDVDPSMSNHDALYAVTDNAVAGADLYRLRDEVAADLVALVRPYHDYDPTCGVGWMNGGGRMPQNIQDHYGVSVSNVAPCGPYVLAHELGHNMGSAHDRETMSVNGHLDYGVYAYSFGYRQDGPPAFATVMAYAVGEQPWLGYFSNPVSTSCGAACGVQDQADNVRSLRNMAPVIAAFRGPPGTLSIADAEVYESEAQGPTAYLTFTVRLSGVAPAAGVRFNALVTNGTAKAGADYLAPAQQEYVIEEGQREAAITVELIGDAVKEADETITVTLANVTGATAYDGEAVGRIVNDDPRLKLSGRVRFEGAPAPASSLWLNVTRLSSAFDSTSLELVPPDFAYQVSVVKGASPTFHVHAPAPFAILPFTLDEVGASSVQDIQLKKGVRVSGKVTLPPGQPALTELMWLDFRASIDGVYQLLSASALKPPGFEYSQWVVPGAWVYMELTPPAPYQRVVANRPEARADFVQDLPLSTLPGLIVWGISRVPEGPAGWHGMTGAVVELSAPAPAGGVRLRYRTVDGTAKAGRDYDAVSGTLEIPEGQTAANTADIGLIGDGTREGDENFYVVVSDVVGANPVVTRVEFILDEPGPRMSKPLPPLKR